MKKIIYIWLILVFFVVNNALASRREEFFPNRIEPILKSVCNDSIPEIASLGKLADQMIADGKLKFDLVYGGMKCNRHFYLYRENDIFYIQVSIDNIRRTYMCSGKKRFTNILIGLYTHEIYHLIYETVVQDRKNYKPHEVMRDLVDEESWVTAEHIINVIRPMMDADRVDNTGFECDEKRLRQFNNDPCDQRWREYIIAKDLAKQVFTEETAVIGRPVKPRKK